MNPEDQKTIDELRASIEAEYGGRGDHVVNAKFVAALRERGDDLKDVAALALAERVQRAQHRKRTKKERDSVPVKRNGLQLSFPFRKLRFSEADECVGREMSHGRGSISNAEYDAFYVAMAKERCRERGLDPDTMPEVTLDEFVTVDEVNEAWARRTAGAPADDSAEGDN